MTESYTAFDNSDDQEGHEDDEMDALGSILSWDENEDGGVENGGDTNAALSDQISASALPDLVSFNALKDGGMNVSALHRLLGHNSAATSHQSMASLSMPNPSLYSGGTESSMHQGLHQAPAADSQNGGISQPSNTNTTHQSAQQMVQAQSVPQHQHQNQHASGMDHIGNPVFETHARTSVTEQPSSESNQTIPQENVVPQQQQFLQTQTSANSSQQTTGLGSSALPAPHAPSQQGSLSMSLYQQGAMLAQSQNAKQQHQQQRTLQPSATQAAPQSVTAAPILQTHHQSKQTQPQTQQAFPFAADQNAVVRQMQIAHLQQQFTQQFNAVQQAQQHVPQPAHGVHAPTQQKHVMAPSGARMTQVKTAAAKAPGTIRSKKPPPTSKINSKSRQASSKAMVVSASDTDGEVTSSVAIKALKNSSMSSSLSAAARKKVDPMDMSNLSPEERARVNRDRNREHARNTRIRKKAYLEKLKSTVEELCRERDTLVSERAGAANILVEMHNTRTEVLMSFFALRSANEKRRELWSSILDESCFACVVPVTPYRSFPASEVQVSKCQRTILGIDGMMADTASLHVLLNSLVDRSRYPNATITFRYTLVTEEAVVAGNQMMARWVMTTLNATQCGARMEIAKQGMLCCKFNSAHKIIGLELMFDVMALMLQLKQAAGSDTFSVVPNTVQTCQRNFDMPMLMMLAEEPYTMVQVNKLWENMCGYQAEEVVGKFSCRILEGEETDPGAVEALINEIRYKRPASAMVVHYKKSGERFRNFFLAFPLSTDSRITHYLMLSTHVEPISAVISTNRETKACSQVHSCESTTQPLSDPLSNQHSIMALKNMQPTIHTASPATETLQQPYALQTVDGASQCPSHRVSSKPMESMSAGSLKRKAPDTAVLDLQAKRHVA